MVVLLQGQELSRWVLIAIAVGTYLVALLMVSTFRYWSFKEIDFARHHPVQTLLVVILAVMIIATSYELFLCLGFTAYAVSGPVRRLIVGRTAATASAEVAPTKDLP